jgi:exodeoxyribonuclease VII small subunit
LAGNLKFEYAFKKLEEISKRLEQGAEDLDVSIKLYKEAGELVKYCEKTLSNAEQEIEVLN